MFNLFNPGVIHKYVLVWVPALDPLQSKRCLQKLVESGEGSLAIPEQRRARTTQAETGAWCRVVVVYTHVCLPLKTRCEGKPDMGKR